MFKQKKNTYMKVCALLIVTLLSGCSSSKGVKAVDGQSANSKNPKEMVDFKKTGYPVVEEKINLDVLTVKRPQQADYHEMQVIKDAEEITNIHLNWEMAPQQSLTEKINLYFASNDMPDIFFNGVIPTQLVTQGMAGQLIPLNKLIDEYAPNVKKVLDENPYVKNTITAPDGNMYSLFLATSGKSLMFKSKMYINQEWLDTLGLDKPKTVDEFYNALKAFREKDPNGNGKNDEIPFSIEPQRIAEFCAPWGVTSEYATYNGEVTFGFMEDGYKQGLKFLNKLFKENLLDKEMFTQNYSQIISKASAEEVIVGSSIRKACTQVAGKNSSKYTYMEPMIGPDGIKLSSHSNIGYVMPGRFAISSSNKHPEISMLLANYFYSPEGSLSLNRGKRGINWEYNEEGIAEILPTPEGMSYAEFVGKYAPNGASPSCMGLKGYEVKWSGDIAKLEKFTEENYMPYVKYSVLPDMLYAPEDTERLLEIQPTIDKYVNEMTAKFVTGKMDIDEEWEVHIKTLKKMGVEELYNIIQNRYKQFND